MYLIILFLYNPDLLEEVLKEWEEAGVENATVQFSTGMNTEAILVEDEKLGEAIEKFFDNTSSGMDDLGDVDLDGLDVEAVDDDGKDAGEGNAADDAPVVRFVNKMLLDSIKGGSSDLHFEPYEKSYRVRFRTDGILHEIARPPVQLAPRISARLKVMAGLDISERRKPQEATSETSDELLSSREIEIMKRVQQGKTNAEIAQILDISAFTVKNHLQRVFKKLGVFNRTQAVSKFEKMQKSTRV